MSDYIKQRPPEKLKYVDEELLVDKTGRRAFKSAAYSVGIAIGFLILSPLLPEMGPEGRDGEVVAALRGVAYWMIAYALAVTLAFFFVRKHVKIVLFMLNWLVLPAVAINTFLDIQDILAGG